MSGATIGADTVASHALRARKGFHVASGAQDQIDQLIERRHTFLTLALQQATKTPIFGWCHNEKGGTGDQASRSRNPRDVDASPRSRHLQPVVTISLRTARLLSLAAPGNAANRHGSVLSVPRRCSTTMNSGRDRVKRGTS